MTFEFPSFTALSSFALYTKRFYENDLNSGRFLNSFCEFFNVTILWQKVVMLWDRYIWCIWFWLHFELLKNLRRKVFKELNVFFSRITSEAKPLQTYCKCNYQRHFKSLFWYIQKEFMYRACSSRTTRNHHITKCFLFYGKAFLILPLCSVVPFCFSTLGF